jgi:hypothetical protein
LLTFIVLACNMHVGPLKREETDFDRPPQGCQVVREEILLEDPTKLTPYACMMQSPVMLPKFMLKHPGLVPRKWSCEDLPPTQNL